MDDEAFDRLALVVARASSRRALLKSAAGMVAAVLGGFGLRPAARSSPECPPGWYPCDPGWECRDLNADELNCGACGNRCLFNAACITGECVCNAGILCGDICVNQLTDPNNCGDCGITCPFNASCIGGECSCNSGILCGGICVNELTDPSHCGACYNPCPPNASCVNGECVCDTGILCGGICVNPQTDPEHCGGCPNLCPPNASCINGQCVCDTGVLCGDICVNTQTDPSHCGDCDIQCPFNATCINGECVCDSGIFCDGICVNPLTDPTNCGDCGITCSETQICCDAYCVEWMTDPEHCGGCGIRCADGEVCSDGVCTSESCDEGLTDCDGSCVDLQTSEEHCGECGQRCPEGQACVDGTCVPPGTPTSQVKPKPDMSSLWTGDTRLRGAHIYQREAVSGDDAALLGSGAVGPAYASTDFEKLASLGANVVTISHPAVVGANPPYGVAGDLRDNLSRLVELAAGAGLWSVISFRTGPGRTEGDLASNVLCRGGGCFAPATGNADPASASATVWSDGAAQTGWITAWTEAARLLKDHPAVIGYELMAFPDPPDTSSWTRFAAAMVQAIRTVDTVTPIIGTAPAAPGSVLEQPVAQGVSLIQGFDRLEPERYLAQPPNAPSMLSYPGRFVAEMDGESGVFDEKWVTTRLAGVERFERTHTMPATVTAFGVSRYQLGAADFLDAQMTAFEKIGVNYSLWAWYPGEWSPTDDAFDISRGPDPDRHEAVDNDMAKVVSAHWKKNRDFLLDTPS